MDDWRSLSRDEKLTLLAMTELGHDAIGLHVGEGTIVFASRYGIQKIADYIETHLRALTDGELDLRAATSGVMSHLN